MATLMALNGCSNDNDSSNTQISNIENAITIGVGDFDNALVRSAVITDGGRIAVDDDGRLLEATRELSVDGVATIPLFLGDSYSLIANGIKGDVPSSRTCQLVDGCNVAGSQITFGQQYSIADAPGWRTVVIAPSDGERAVITPLTELAVFVAENLIYFDQASDGLVGCGSVAEGGGADSDEANGEWCVGEGISAPKLNQSYRFIADMFSLSDIENIIPADLTRLNDFENSEQFTAVNAIAYGAILAAWQKRELEFLSEPFAPYYHSTWQAEFLSNVDVNDANVSKEFGQVSVDLLRNLLADAIDNLSNINGLSGRVDAIVDLSIGQLEQHLDDLPSDGSTDFAARPLNALLTDAELDSLDLGLKQTKAFINFIANDLQSFFEEGYAEELDEYVQQLKGLGDENEDALKLVLDAYLAIYDRYLICVNDGCANEDYDPSTKTLRIVEEGVDVTVAQVTADADGNEVGSASRFVDVTIDGIFNSDGVRLSIQDGDASNDRAALRVIHDREVSTLTDDENGFVIAYEVRWPLFELEVSGELSSEIATIGGRFSAVYLGVDAPDGGSGKRFNLAEVALDGRISEGDSNDESQDGTVSTVSIAAASTNAEFFYPDERFAQFDGFFTPTNTIDSPSAIAEMFRLATGTETINEQSVELVDVISDVVDYQKRFRFYPNVVREDEFDADGDGRTDDTITTHDFEQCDLSATTIVCLPKQRLNSERDINLAINELWELGVLSRIELPGQGTYFANWPATPDSRGCFKLDSIVSDTVIAGSLIDEAVVGLDSARLSSEISLGGRTELTFVDATITAPTPDNIVTTIAVSHDYDTLVADSFISGQGERLDRLVLSFDTRSLVSNSGSIAIFKDGVSLSLDGEQLDSVDSELFAFGKLGPVSTPQPFVYKLGSAGTEELCVTANEPSVVAERDLTDAEFVLSFRGVVYGSLRNENGIWLVRYVDGSFQTPF